MAQSQQFLDDFQQKMNRLADIRRNLQASIQFKQQFTDDLKTKLGEINGKVKQLTGLINDLKTKADDLEKQVGTNATSISDRERQIGEINQQIANTSAEKDRITQEFNDHKGRTQTQINEQQAKIDQLEEQLRQLTEQLRVANEQKEAAENNFKALQADTQASGDEKDKAHALALAQLAEENRKQLEQQQQQLTQRIDEADKKVTELEEQLRQKTAEHEQSQQQLGENQNQAQGQVAELQRQIDVLTQENQQLIQRLMAATQAINEANDELEAIVNSVPNAQTKQEVDALLNEITAQLEQSIQNISRAAQGQPPQGTQGGQVDPNTNFEISGYNISYGQIFSQLNRKSTQLARTNPGSDNKYKTALTQIKASRDPANIPTILNTNGITIKAAPDGSGVISGGRKTRKNRKQKGGFTYKVGVKRRNITSTSKSRRTSRFSSRKSSRKSSR